MRPVLVLAALVVAFAAPAAGSELEGSYFSADTSRTGHVRLLHLAAPGTRVDFFERAPEGPVALGSAVAGDDAFAVLPSAVTWRCDRLVRTFEAIVEGATGPPAVFDVRTPSCRRRLRVDAPRSVRPGAPVRTTLRDTWATGAIEPQVCASAPGARTRCRTLTLRPGTERASTTMRLRRRGEWTFSAALDRYVTERRVGVGLTPATRRRAPLPRVLATGDSTIDGIDGYLADALARRARVVRDVHIGTGISKPAALSWTARASRQARRARPQVTVVSLGAVDGFPLAGADCCDEAWQAEYARRARAMLEAYRRDGRGRVLWLSLPAARDPDFARIAAGVNAAVARAVSGLSWAQRVPLDEIFTPDGAYRADLERGGRTIRVRAGDGLHLSAAGKRIAARAVARVLRGWL